jgi:hypothetical protein
MTNEWEIKDSVLILNVLSSSCGGSFVAHDPQNGRWETWETTDCGESRFCETFDNVFDAVKLAKSFT